MFASTTYYSRQFTPRRSVFTHRGRTTFQILICIWNDTSVRQTGSGIILGKRLLGQALINDAAAPLEEREDDDVTVLEDSFVAENGFLLRRRDEATWAWIAHDAQVCLICFPCWVLSGAQRKGSATRGPIGVVTAGNEKTKLPGVAGGEKKIELVLQTSRGNGRDGGTERVHRPATSGKALNCRQGWERENSTKKHRIKCGYGSGIEEEKI
ncbi:hypothetical protein V8E53_013555 [Lactarius tabidus]